MKNIYKQPILLIIIALLVFMLFVFMIEEATGVQMTAGVEENPCNKCLELCQ